MSRLFDTGKSYNFSVWPSEILGTGFNSVLVEAVAGYQMAKRFADLDALHRQIYPTLPEGTPDRPQDFEYLLIRTAMADGTSAPTVVAVPWIKEDSIRLVEGIDFNVLVRNGSLEDMERIRLMLTQNGINNFEIQVVNQ